MSLLTIAQAQALGAGIGLSDADLQIILDREEAELVRQFGAVYTGAAIAETLEVGERERFVYLPRQITSVSSVVEYFYPGDTAPATLVATDYFVWTKTGRIERVSTARYWGAVVTVSYIPIDDTALWRMVLVELVRIGTEQTATGGSVSGLGFTVSEGGGGGANWGNLRSAQYARIGWLSR